MTTRIHRGRWNLFLRFVFGIGALCVAAAVLGAQLGRQRAVAELDDL